MSSEDKSVVCDLQALVNRCVHCGENLRAVSVQDHERRTRIDIVFETRIEHVDAQIKTCPSCQRLNKGAFPDDLFGALQYGLGVKATVLNLLITQMVSLRGGAAMDEINIIPRYGGVIVHDCWASYFSYARCEDALCGAHLLRELEFIIESNGYTWARHMKRLLQRTCATVSAREDKVLSEAEYAKLDKRYTSTAVSFETEPPSLSEFEARIEKAVSGWQWLTAERDGERAGYACASAHRERAAYISQTGGHGDFRPPTDMPSPYAGPLSHSEKMGHPSLPTVFRKYCMPCASN